MVNCFPLHVVARPGLVRRAGPPGAEPADRMDTDHWLCRPLLHETNDSVGFEDMHPAILSERNH
jgi:hypothetical protein